MQIDTVTKFYSLKTYKPCTKINSEIFYCDDHRELTVYTIYNESKTIIRRFDDIVPYFTTINGRAYILCKDLYSNTVDILNMDFKIVKTLKLDGFYYTLSNNNKLYLICDKKHINILTFDANLDITSSKTISSIGKSLYLVYKSWLVGPDTTQLVFYDDSVNEVFRIPLTKYTNRRLAIETHIYNYNDYIAIDLIGNCTILVNTNGTSHTIEVKHNDQLLK
jgi:hypothetical protein